MKRAALVSAILLLGALAALLLVRRDGAASSVLGRGSRGWLGMSRVLEERGVELLLLDRSLDRALEETQLRSGDTLVVAFPWQYRTSESPGRGLVRHLSAGGNVVVAYSGEEPTPDEDEVLATLGVALEPRRGSEPLAPWQWRQQRSASARYTPVDRDGAALVGGPLANGPIAAGSDSQPLFADAAGRPVVAVYRRGGGGRLWLLPAELFSNARLAAPGNALLLLSLARAQPGRWVFDELHHGLVARGASQAPRWRLALDLILVQLFGLYLLAVLALARRFAPPWPRLATVAGSHREFLTGLGELHARLGHHREAARKLVERWQRYDPSTTLPEDLAARLADAGPEGFLALSRSLSRPPRVAVGDFGVAARQDATTGERR